MARCSRCDCDTELFVNGSALCPVSDARASEQAKSTRVHKLLREQFNLAKNDLAAATERFDALIREVPSGLPHPDGSQRIYNASRELSEAREFLMKTAARLNKFVAHRIVPSDLDTC